MPDDFKDSKFIFDQAVALARMEEKLIALEAGQQKADSEYREKIEDLQKEVNKLTHERDKAMRWGLVLLGSGVLSLLSWVVKLATGGKLPIP